MGVGEVIAGADMPRPVPMRVGRGLAVVYSSRCPDREGPNQDAALARSLCSQRAVLGVADGLGGQRAGGQASALALQRIDAAVERSRVDDESLRPVILDGIEQANREVLALGVGAATTLAVVELHGSTLRPYHVGDSAIWVVGQRGRIKLQTVAHSPVGYAVEAGLLDEREALGHDQRHVISNSIGASDMRIEIGSPLQLAALDTVLLATDGLLDNLTGPEIVERIRVGRLEDVALDLATLGRRRMTRPSADSPSKPDDLTFVLFRLER